MCSRRTSLDSTAVVELIYALTSFYQTLHQEQHFQELLQTQEN